MRFSHRILQRQKYLRFLRHQHRLHRDVRFIDQLEVVDSRGFVHGEEQIDVAEVSYAQLRERNPAVASARDRKRAGFSAKTPGLPSMAGSKSGSVRKSGFFTTAETRQEAVLAGNEGSTKVMVSRSVSSSRNARAET